MNSKEKGGHIIIIGAGAAGLMAARILSTSYQVTILEAKQVTGGRIHSTLEKDFPEPVEGGAEFVHGELPVTLGLLREAGIGYTEVTGNMYRFSKGKLAEQEEMTEGWEELLHCMGTLETDTTMTDFLEQHYSGPAHKALRQAVNDYLQGFDLADPGRVSVKSLYEEWANEGDKNFRVEGGYGRLIRFLEQACNGSGCAIHTGSVVKEIQWERNKVRVTTTDGRVFRGQRVMVTVSAGVLQSPHFVPVFSPALPACLDAAGAIGYGNVIKLVLLFKEPFWESHKKDIGFLLSKERIPTWWTQLPGSVPLLTGWLGGPASKEWEGVSDDRIIAAGLQSLEAIFGTEAGYLSTLLVKGLVYNWAEDPYALGAYSYSTPLSDAAKRLLNTPVEDTVYFAGEALYEGASPGTVEAALTSGQQVALKISELHHV